MYSATKVSSIKKLPKTLKKLVMMEKPAFANLTLEKGAPLLEAIGDTLGETLEMLGFYTSTYQTLCYL